MKPLDDESTSWTKDILSFSDKPLGEVIATLTRYRNGVLRFLNIDLMHHHNALDDTVAAAQILVHEANEFGVEQIKPLVKVI